MTRIYSKALALSLLLLVLIAVVELLAAPLWRMYQGNQQTIGELRDQLHRYTAVAATRADTQGLLQRLEEHLEQDGLTLDQPNSGRAAAALQERVKTLVDAAGAKLMSTRMLPDKNEGGFQRVAAQVGLRATTDSLGPLLLGLEGDFPYLFLDRLSIVSRGRRGGRSGPVASVPLDVKMEITGYLRAKSAAAQASK
jgi:hypothetical protein